MIKPAVSLCMIVRDEEKNLGHCLKGLAGLVSEIIVVDTGSTDATRKIAGSLGAKVFDFAWVDDFSAARNESCRHATGDYILWMDADDRLDEVNLKRVEDLLENLAARDPARESVFMMCSVSKSPTSASDIGATHLRLFPNRAGIRWVGRAHERLEFGGNFLKFVNTEVMIRHEGYTDAVEYSKKRHRNSRILEQEFLANPDDVWNLFYLGRVRNWQGNMPEAIRFLQRSIRLDPRSRAVTTPFAFLLVADSLRKMGRRDEASQSLDEGLSRYPDFAALLFSKACVLRESRRYADAESAFRRLLALSSHQLKEGPVFFDLQRERWRLMLGDLLHEQGRVKEAGIEYRQALAEYPDSTEAWFALGQLNIQLECRREVEAVARRLEACPNGAFESSMLRAQLCILERKFDEARHWISRAIAIQPKDARAHGVRSVLLFREGRDWEQCREAHETLLNLDPNNTEARRRLEQARACLARQKALESLGDYGNGREIHPAILQHSDLGAGCGLSFSC